jgi:hypothetical protein
MLSLPLDITELVDFLDKWLLQSRHALNQGFLVVKFKIIYIAVSEIK